MADNVEEIVLLMGNKKGDWAQRFLVQDGLQAFRNLSPEALVSSSTSDPSCAFTEQMEIEGGTDATVAFLSPAAGVIEANVDSGVRLGTQMSEILPFRQVFVEIPGESGLESPVSGVLEEKTCWQDRTPVERMLSPACAFSSEKENPGSPQAPVSDLRGHRSITRAPMKPARMNLLNQAVKSSSVRRRLNFDGL